MTNYSTAEEMAEQLAAAVWDLRCGNITDENITDDQKSAIREQAFSFSREVSSRGANDVSKIRLGRRLAVAILVWCDEGTPEAWTRLVRASLKFEGMRLQRD